MVKTERAVSVGLISLLGGLSLFLYGRYLRQKELRNMERRGRISAEKKLRGEPDGRQQKNNKNKTNTEEKLEMRIVARVRSCFDGRNGTPRQSMLVPSARSCLVFEKGMHSPDCIDGLSNFSHLIVIFVFHENTNMAKSGEAQLFRPKIVPPRLEKPIGVFASRSPHRANPIGLSTVQIDYIEDGVVYLRGADLVDGTPVLDIKPFIPAYDNPRDAVVPEWVVEHSGEKFAVQINCDIDDSELKFYRNDRKAFLELVTEVLAYDIRSLHKKNTNTKDQHSVVLDGMRLDFELHTGRRTVVVTHAARERKNQDQTSSDPDASHSFSAPQSPLASAPSEHAPVPAEPSAREDWELVSPRLPEPSTP